jgi:hypothetical protein
MPGTMIAVIERPRAAFGRSSASRLTLRAGSTGSHDGKTVCGAYANQGADRLHPQDNAAPSGDREIRCARRRAANCRFVFDDAALN